MVRSRPVIRVGFGVALAATAAGDAPLGSEPRRVEVTVLVPVYACTGKESG